jgi:hypothetical protein
MNDVNKELTGCMKRFAEHTIVPPLRLGNVDKIVITELWQGITAEEYGGVT